MTIKNTMLRITAVSVVVFSFHGCENDFDTIGGNIIGEPGFNAELYEDAEITAYTHNLPPVQTNNIPTNLYNLLGVQQDEVFGKQAASIFTQLSLSAASPSFGTEPVLDSVVLNIPYFSTEVEAGENENKKYELDSILGNSPIKLSVLVSDFYLNEYDPETDFKNRQKYYSDLGAQIENNLTGDTLFKSENFLPSAAEIVEFGVDEDGQKDTIRSAPRMRIHLSTQFFKENILDKEGSAELSSNNNFRNFLRGLYLKAEADVDGNLMLLDIAQGEAGITLYYTSQETNSDDETSGVSKEFKLNFGPGRVNTFEQEMPELTDENLYLKGGEGSMAVIELFNGVDSDGDGVSDELEFLRDNEWLINEANLLFHVNRNAGNFENEPEQLYLFDLNNNRMLADYRFDKSDGSANDLNSTTNRNHLGPLERDEDGKGIKYKIRLTEHINNLLNEDTENVKLGLVVSQNVNILSNSAVKNSSNPEVDRVPVSSVISPSGTVLYGTETADEEKRLKLRIYYTEPKN